MVCDITKPTVDPICFQNHINSSHYDTILYPFNEQLTKDDIAEVCVQQGSAQ
jgi:hypothetical protein